MLTHVTVGLSRSGKIASGSVTSSSSTHRRSSKSKALTRTRLTRCGPVCTTVPADPTSNFNTGNPAGNQGISTHDIVVPAGTSLLRVSMFDAETDGDDDIDLYLYRVNADTTLTLVDAVGIVWERA